MNREQETEKTATGTCRSCRWWEPSKGRDGAAILQGGLAQGACHRNPPGSFVVPDARGLKLHTQFPATHSAMWCGGFAPEVAVRE